MTLKSLCRYLYIYIYISVCVLLVGPGRTARQHEHKSQFQAGFGGPNPNSIFKHHVQLSAPSAENIWKATCLGRQAMNSCTTAYLLEDSEAIPGARIGELWGLPFRSPLFREHASCREARLQPCPDLPIFRMFSDLQGGRLCEALYFLKFWDLRSRGFSSLRSCITLCPIPPPCLRPEEFKAGGYPCSADLHAPHSPHL